MQARPDSGTGLASVLHELKQREPLFHRPELGTKRSDFERMTAEDFWEIGASGRQYDRAFILDVLDARHEASPAENLQASDFRIREIASDTYLLHYTLLQGMRKTRRTTLWKHFSDGWKIVFHQGAVVQE